VVTIQMSKYIIPVTSKIVGTKEFWKFFVPRQLDKQLSSQNLSCCNIFP
jgi:hypothetical protein